MYGSQENDPKGFGSHRSHTISGNQLCVVTAVAMALSWFPEGIIGAAEAHLPFCRWTNGELIRREVIQQALQDAATATGLPRERVMPHSLRIGGASALYHATGNIETVKRFGGWKSQTFHDYLWDSAEQNEGLAGKMARDEATIHYT